MAALDPDPLVKPRDAAVRIRTSLRTVYRLAAAGHLDSVQVSPRGLRIRESSIDNLIKHGIRAPKAQEAK